MADIIYTSAKRDLINGSIDLDTDDIKIMLVTSGYVPNADSHTKKSDITNEISGAGYTAGGISLVNKVVTADTGNHRGVFDADDSAWATATFTARGAVIYKSRGGAATADELLCYIDFTTDKSPSAAEMRITWSASGILTIS